MSKQVQQSLFAQLTRQIANAVAILSVAIVGSLSLTTSSVNAAEGNMANGEKLSQTCLGCHGAPGLRNPGPVYEIPMIGGQHPEYIVSALQAYKAKTRSHGTMQAQASNLSDQDMLDIATYFNSFSGNSRPSAVNKTLAAKGKEESAVCAACHSATGDGDNTAYPKLAGQYQSYLQQSLKDYRSGERENAIMAGFASALTIDQIEALSAWFASQPGGLSAPESKIFK